MRRLAHAAARARTVTLDVEGRAVPALEGEPVACALIAAGQGAFGRAGAAGGLRGAACFAGVCGQCRMRVDGLADVYTCRTPARAGMRLERQDVGALNGRVPLETLEWMLPAEHRGSNLLDAQALAGVVGELAGLGLVADRAPPPLLPARELKTQAAIVGGGAAGLAAAAVLGAHGVPFLLFEREGRVGGRLRVGAPEPDAPAMLDVGTLPSSALRRGCAAVGLHADDGGRYLLVLALEPNGVRLTKVYAERFLLAVGSRPTLVSFPGSDLPGVYAGHAASRLARVHRVLPSSAALVGWGRELYALARLYLAAGTEVRALVDLHGEPPPDAPAGACPGSAPAALGEDAVTGFRFASASGAQLQVPCEVIAVCAPPVPAVELARQGGARVEGERLVCDEEGRTEQRDLFVAGDVTGWRDARGAALSGERAAAALVRELL
jgi:sarcosine oxidase, subunit alpha